MLASSGGQSNSWLESASPLPPLQEADAMRSLRDPSSESATDGFGGRCSSLAYDSPGNTATPTATACLTLPSLPEAGASLPACTADDLAQQRNYRTPFLTFEPQQHACRSAASLFIRDTAQRAESLTEVSAAAEATLHELEALLESIRAASIDLKALDPQDPPKVIQNPAKLLLF